MKLGYWDGVEGNISPPHHQMVLIETNRKAIIDLMFVKALAKRC